MLLDTAPARVSLYIPMCSGVRPDQIIVPLYKGTWSDRIAKIAPRCYLDDAERVHAVLCRERGQGSRV